MDADLVRQCTRWRPGGVCRHGLCHRGSVPRGVAPDLGDIYLAEDATQQALLGVWQDLPQLRDPARFEAWSYRPLVPACYAEGRLAPGTLGDVTILSGDVLAATPDEVRAMTVIATIVGGIPAYCADAALCVTDDQVAANP